MPRKGQSGEKIVHAFAAGRRTSAAALAVFQPSRKTCRHLKTFCLTILKMTVHIRTISRPDLTGRDPTR